MSMKQIHIGSAYLGPKTRFSKPNYQYIIVFKKYIYENDEITKTTKKNIRRWQRYICGVYLANIICAPTMDTIHQ